MKTNQEISSQVESKQVWAKPELEMVSIKEQTLGGGVGVDDGLNFS